MVSEIFKDRPTDGRTNGRTDQRTRVITEDPLGRTRGPKLGTFQKKSKIQKSITCTFRYYIEVQNIDQNNQILTKFLLYISYIFLTSSLFHLFHLEYWNQICSIVNFITLIPKINLKYIMSSHNSRSKQHTKVPLEQRIFKAE